LCRARTVENISFISAVVTHEECRNKGFASSLLSYMLEDLFKKVDIVLLYVSKENEPAIRLYNKRGFRSYKSYANVWGNIE